MSKYKILFKFASRERPEKLINGLSNIIDNLADRENYHIVVSLDENDRITNTNYVLAKLKPYLENNNVTAYTGESKSKIDAINRDMENHTDWDILVNFSDDMQFQYEGFDDIIRLDMARHFIDTDGVLHYSDGFTHDKICTMCIMGLKYYNRFNYIYHNSYKSLWADNEYTQVAKILEKYVYIDMILYQHLHPANTGGVVDQLYVRNESLWKEDEKTFNERSKRNFDLKLKPKKTNKN